MFKTAEFIDPRIDIVLSEIQNTYDVKKKFAIEKIHLTNNGETNHKKGSTALNNQNHTKNFHKKRGQKSSTAAISKMPPRRNKTFNNETQKNVTNKIANSKQKIDKVSRIGNQKSKNTMKDLLNRQNQQKMEIEYIGHFLLHLHCRLILKDDFILNKNEVREEFKKYLKLPERQSVVEKIQNECFRDVGARLQKTGFLKNTSRRSNHFQINRLQFFKFRNMVFQEMDNKCKNGVNYIPYTKTTEMAQTGPLDAGHLFVEVDLNSKEYPLYYKVSRKQKKIDEFCPTNIGCYICQKNYPSQEKFEEHVEHHSDNSDFESLNDLTKFKEPFFILSYRLCKKSHYFSFTMKTKEKDVVVDKIIIVQTRSMYFVKNTFVPFEITSAEGIDTFFVDSHLFTKFVEHPIVIIFHRKLDKEYRCVEEHHIIITEEYPQVHFRTKSVRLNTGDLLKKIYKLPKYFPSIEMKSAQNKKFSSDSLCRASLKFKEYLNANKNLSEDSMSSVFNILLQIEDLDSMHKYLNLCQHNTKISRFGTEYSMRLNQNAKKTNEKMCASKIINPFDEIILIPLNKKKHYEEVKKHYQTIDILMPDLDEHVYVATVENVYNNRVFFTYKKKRIPTDCYYNVVFRPSRLTLIYQYRALVLLNANLAVRQLLFPQRILETKPSAFQLDLFNPTIASCAEQLQAVQNIADGPLQHAPYIIFGPPGTGKTTTIVEAILQLWKLRPCTRILVTAGSNSACDEVALRLCKVFAEITPNSRELLRIFSKSNDKRLDSIDELLLESSNSFNAHFYPAVESIEQYRIVVCTLSVIGQLVTGNFGRNNFFSHIFVDEAAASTEPEVLVGLMGTLSTKCRLIISGDHKQLGAVLHSEISKEHGLDISIMERLLTRSCYAVDKNGDYDRSIQTRLRSNHRSHFEIVNIFNHLFYDSELVARANLDDVSMGTKWHGLLNPKFPIIFHSVFGTSAKSSSNSLHNYKEIDVVMEYVKDLMFFGINGKPIKQSDIGIISPYKSQYTLIQEELNLRHWYKIETGSVEIFQGREKPIVVVSMVRSYTKTLGFLDSRRRLNVTLSRAKSLLIVIGNPITLSMSDDFKYLINRCKKKKSFIGSTRRNYNKIVNSKRDGAILDNLCLSMGNLDLSTANLKTNNYFEEKQKRTMSDKTQKEEFIAAKEPNIRGTPEIFVVKQLPNKMSTYSSKFQNKYQVEYNVQESKDIVLPAPSVHTKNMLMPHIECPKHKIKLKAAAEPMPRRTNRERVIKVVANTNQLSPAPKLSQLSVASATALTKTTINRNTIHLSPVPKPSQLSVASAMNLTRTTLDPIGSTEVVDHKKLSKNTYSQAESYYRCELLQYPSSNYQSQIDEQKMKCVLS